MDPKSARPYPDAKATEKVPFNVINCALFFTAQLAARPRPKPSEKALKSIGLPGRASRSLALVGTCALS